MDTDLFLQRLRELPVEEGRQFIREDATEITDYHAIGKLIKVEALRQRGINPLVSLKLADLLIFYGEYIHLPLIRALGLVARGDVLEYFGNYQGALEAFDDAGEIFLRHGDKVNWAHSRIGWILPCAWLGRTEEALQEAAQAREVFLDSGERYWACVLDHNTAVIYTQMGRYQKALELYERMLTIYPTLTDIDENSIQLAIAMVKLNQARNLSWLGDFEQAYRLLYEAHASGVALGATGHIINAEFNLAELDYAQGYYGSALRRYYQVRDSLIQHKFDEPVVMASMTQRMAVCLVKLNRVQEACLLAAEAVAACRQLGAALYTGDALREYAVTLIASGRPQEALAALDEAQALFTQGGLEHQASSIKLQQVELLLEIGDTGTVYNQARSIRAYFDEQGFVERSVLASLVMVNALIKMIQQAGVGEEEEQQTNRLREAMLLSKDAARQARQHNLQEQFYRSQHVLGKLAALQGDTRNASRHYQSAIAQIERILNDLVYDLSPLFLHTTWAVYEDMISLCLQQKQFERAFSYLERVRSITLRRYLNRSKVLLNESEQSGTVHSSSVSQANNAIVLQIQSELGRWQEKYHKYSTQLANLDTSLAPIIDREIIEAELKRCEAMVSELFERLHLHEFDTHATYRGKGVKSERSTQKVQLVDVAQLRQQLAPGQLLLAYYLYKSELVIFALTTAGLITYENPDGAAQLEMWLHQLHAHLDPTGLSGLTSQRLLIIRRLLNKLYDLLIAPVSALLPAAPGFITIVPYGPLHKLPFHALFDGSHFLIEDFQVNYLPVSSILTHPGKQMMYLNDVDGFAHPDHVKSDATLAGHVPTRSPLIFGYSDKGDLQRVLDEAKTLAALLNGRCYLEEEATIARLIEQAPGSPIIHLATHGKSRIEAPNFSYIRLADGQLNAIDAFSLNLAGCELVTLSGCETGLAFSGGGDEQLGLGRAFLASGATSLVMSLWPVEDNATNDLMQLFYQYLMKGETKVQALRAAQCSLLHEPTSKYAHPYFWASFRLVGDVGPLRSANVQGPLLAVETRP